MKKLLVGLLGLITFYACNQTTASTSASTVLYYNGDIITMADSIAQYAEALVVKDGKILFVGTKSAAEKEAGSSATLIDLQGKTLLPGFIDAHSHVAQGINSITEINVSCPPVGNCSSVADIIKTIEAFKVKNNIANGEWLMAWGYDNELISEKRHPNLTELDKAFPNNPVIMAHVSGHMAVCNSAALKLANITAQTKDPAGGHIERDAKGNLTGLLQENAAFLMVSVIPQISMDKKVALLDDVINQYAENGYTTIQEGLSDHQTFELLTKAVAKKPFQLDVISLLDSKDIDRYINDKTMVFGKYSNGLKWGGIKIVGDGSPQGKTAYFLKPYCNHGICDAKDGFRGAPNLSASELDSLFYKCYTHNIQLYMHCNGDASVDMFLQSNEKNKTVGTANDRRSVIIHSQFVNRNQLAQIKAHHIIPSFFTNHAYFWGNVHRNNLGEERANFLSPIATADSMGIVYTNHTDFRITPLDPMFVLWTAVNRLSREGVVIGTKERATPYQALKGITSNVAYQYFEEKEKGKLIEGYTADLVILDKNPLKVEPQLIKDIKVLETIKDGKLVFKR
ncbi:MAG: amidohydrolase [Ferruginibacter sp.]